MLLHVVHETRYDYAPAVKTAQHMAHLQPATTATASACCATSWKSIRVRRSAAMLSTCYGNKRTVLQPAKPRTKNCRWWPTSVVAAIRSRAVPPSAVSWEAARERLRYHRGAKYDAAAEFVFASPYVPRHPDSSPMRDPVSRRSGRCSKRRAS